MQKNRTRKRFNSNVRPKISSPIHPVIKDRSMPLFPTLADGPSLVPRSTSQNNVGEFYLPSSRYSPEDPNDDANASFATENDPARTFISRHLHQIPGTGVFKKVKDAISARRTIHRPIQDYEIVVLDPVFEDAAKKSAKVEKICLDRGRSPRKKKHIRYHDGNAAIGESNSLQAQPFADHGYVSAAEDDETETSTLHPHSREHSILQELERDKFHEIEQEEVIATKKTRMSFGMALTHGKYPDFDANRDSLHNNIEYYGSTETQPAARRQSEDAPSTPRKEGNSFASRRFSTSYLHPSQPGSRTGKTRVGSHMDNHKMIDFLLKAGGSGLDQHPNVMEFIECPDASWKAEIKECTHRNAAQSASVAASSVVQPGHSGLQTVSSNSKHSKHSKREDRLVTRSLLKSADSGKYKYIPEVICQMGDRLPGLHHNMKHSMMGRPPENTDPSQMGQSRVSIESPKRSSAEAGFASQVSLALNKKYKKDCQREESDATTNKLSFDSIGNDASELDWLSSSEDQMLLTNLEKEPHFYHDTYTPQRTLRGRIGSKSSLDSTKSWTSLKDIRSTIKDKLPRFTRGSSMPVSEPLEPRKPAVNFSRRVGADNSSQTKFFTPESTTCAGKSKEQHVSRAIRKGKVPDMRTVYQEGDGSAYCERVYDEDYFEHGGVLYDYGKAANKL